MAAKKAPSGGYNPTKPARPSHVLHTFWVGNLRLVLDVQVSSGKQQTSVHAKTALARLLDELSDRRPALVRGDSGYGNESIVLELQSRDRADCENGFDELKNQWGQACGLARPARLSGFTTQDINRCETTAWACALVYNWWSWYCRAANPTARMEANTSRPLLLAAVCRATHSAGQTTLYLTPLHGKTGLLKSLIANIHAALQHVQDAAEQFKTTDRWAVLLRYVSQRIAPVIGPFRPPQGLPATG